MDDEATVAELSRPALDRRLDRRASAPLVVAFSGGGDSLALLLGARRWAREAGRRLLAVTIDHRLQAAGADWALWCARRAASLGVDHRVLVWDADKPRTGLAAAARAARHDLLAEAAREAGAGVILMGHTADDRLEAGLMRGAGGSVPDPREWSPAPFWPRGRDLFILRPLLDRRRSEIRSRLAAAGETWLEDPANADLRHPRARARLALADGGDVEPPALQPAVDLSPVSVTSAGEIIIPLTCLAAQATGRRLLGAALLCASGAARPARRDRLDRLMERVLAAEPLTATLAGARVQSDGRFLRVVREGGDIARAGGAAALLPVGRPLVWDGRFELFTASPGLKIAALAGYAARLDRSHRDALAAMPPAVRRGLPVILDAEGRASSPLLVKDPRIGLRCLVQSRLLAACGAVTDESGVKVRSGSASDTLNRVT